jgi:hypothetical protein
MDRGERQYPQRVRELVIASAHIVPVLPHIPPGKRPAGRKKARTSTRSPRLRFGSVHIVDEVEGYDRVARGDHLFAITVVNPILDRKRRAKIIDESGG